MCLTSTGLKKQLVPMYSKRFRKHFLYNTENVQIYIELNLFVYLHFLTFTAVTSLKN